MASDENTNRVDEYPRLKSWIAQLEDADWAKRREAADELGAMGPEAEGALESLWERIANDEDPDVIASADAAIAEIATEGDIVPKLQDANSNVREAAINLLAPSESKAVHDSVIKLLPNLLKDKSRGVRQRALDYLRINSDKVSAELGEIHKNITETLWWLAKEHQEGFDVICTIVDAKQVLERLPTLELGDEVIGQLILDPIYEYGYDEVGTVEKLWVSNREVVLSYLLAVLRAQAGEDSFGPYEYRSIAAEWLYEKADDIPVASQDKVRKALFPLLGDLDPEVRERGSQTIQALEKQDVGSQETIFELVAMGEGKEIPTETVARALFLNENIYERLGEAWRQTGGTEHILPHIDVALKHKETSRKAVRWLKERANEIPKEWLKPLISTLEQRRVEDDDTDVRRLADETIDRLRPLTAGVDHKEIEDRLIILQADEQALEEPVSGADKVGAINRLVEMGEQGRDWKPHRDLIEVWAQWIASNKNSSLVEAAAGKMRTAQFAVWPLVERLERKWELTPAIQDELAGELKEELDQELKEETAATKSEIIKTRVEAEFEARKLRVRRRIARQLAEMSDLRFFESLEDKRYKLVKKELSSHAVPALEQLLPKEEDLEIRESLAHTLANISSEDGNAIRVLCQAVVGEARARRQELLAEYYLEPARERSQQVAKILDEAVAKAKTTLERLQWLNIAVFVLGFLFIGTSMVFVFISDDPAMTAAGLFAGFGGLAGLIQLFIRSPLNRIQNTVANLVQLETAFSSFIWELNLNSTFIQSQYVAEGTLSNDEIALTVGRIENAMSLTMEMLAAYTEQIEHAVPHIRYLLPMSATKLAGKKVTVTVYGQNFPRDTQSGLGRVVSKASGVAGQEGRKRLVAINHTPIDAKSSWAGNKVEFDLPEQIPGLEAEEGWVWISLFIDGIETNALPFLVQKANDT